MGHKNEFKSYLTAYHDEVTGSCFMLIVENTEGEIVARVLIDCGLRQEIKYRYLNFVDEMNPKFIDAIIITHNHIDHTGNVPKLVKQGFNGKIYMTSFTRDLIEDYWLDSAKQQDSNAEDMKERFPETAYMYSAQYHVEDVKKALKLCKGISYREEIEIVPSVKLTFFENGHLLGAGMPFIRCSCYGKKSFNYFFTGDYKLTNTFYSVPKLPKWLKKEELIMINESTYGTTESSQVDEVFGYNMKDAFSKKKNILIGGFAQGRMQEVLYKLKIMQDNGIIPSEYSIFVDGPLGIKTTEKYKHILRILNPEMANFTPNDLKVVDPKSRTAVLTTGNPIILVTTSGMLSNGPAQIYVPMFIERKNCMIHLTGYAAEETLARKLLETEDGAQIKIGDTLYTKRADVRTTKEFSSHATADQMVKFINQFKNIQLLIVNHGQADVKLAFCKYVDEYCDLQASAEVIDRNTRFCFYQLASSKDKTGNLVIKKMPVKLNVYQLSKRSQESLKNGKKKKRNSRDGKDYKSKRKPSKGRGYR